MIQSLSKSYLRLFSKQIPLSTPICHIQSCRFVSNAGYKFSTQEQSQQSIVHNQKKTRSSSLNQSQFSPIDYYRNTIRKVNIHSTGRGNFNSYSLSKIVNMSKTQQHAKIMFQAYYNYMGHFTLIQNKIVDQLILKAILIGNQQDKIIEILANHNYLAYFPHFDTINRVIKKFVKQEKYQYVEKVVKILIRSPLIKINNKIFDTLSGLFSQQSCQSQIKQAILKLLILRINLVDDVNNQTMTQKISQLIKSVQTGPFQSKPYIKSALLKLSQSSYISTQDSINRAIILSTFSMISQSGELLTKSNSNIGNQYEGYFNYVMNLYKRSNQEVNYGAMLKEALGEVTMEDSIKSKLEQLENGTAE